MNALSSERWTRLWRDARLRGDPRQVYEVLASFYSQPNRHYHNLQHVAECLSEFDSGRHLAHEPLSVELALWFHDAVYDTRAPDNEERSAELARERLSQSGASPALLDGVASLILATKTHEGTGHPDAPLLIDVDLSILGQTQARFLEYEAQIRMEYDWVPAAIFAEKRAEILQRFLARKRLYTTNLFFDKYETQARSNLGLSISKLK